MVMCKEILERIVKCALFKKISSVADLEKETRWPRSAELGNEVVELALKHCSIPLPEVVPVVRATPRCCSACQNPGHIRTC